ncbi:hypothetical protein BDV96DRAFT_581847 [Lophiotrema nucula]|uniref:Uncharacterized protein n=1 Tax=Lophiotrema nucula TaxID=690887 RepID=A0A6A5YXC6_9PLEO|nr:hypothetical protein BDV96DRAFT_581847 [Lophiotrema nucula]
MLMARMALPPLSFLHFSSNSSIVVDTTTSTSRHCHRYTNTATSTSQHFHRYSNRNNTHVSRPNFLISYLTASQIRSSITTSTACRPRSFQCSAA